MKKIQTITHIGTKHDTNGNPRRAFIINEINLEDARPYPYIIDVVDQGYLGTDAFKDKYPHLEAPGYMIETTPTEYRNFLKIGEAKRKGRNI